MYDRAGYDVCCEWGEQGVLHLAPTCAVVIIVDVLSFSTCVDIAVGRNAIVFPYRGTPESAVEFAASVDAELAYGDHSRSGYTLSPQSLLNLPSGARLVLPSPNGAALTLAAGTVTALTGCLRNCQAVANAAQQLGRRIAVIAAGEHWRSDGTLRPCWEDWVGAGAIISYLDGSRSPEAQAAAALFQSVQAELAPLLHRCSSGVELIQRGRERDVALAAELNAGRFAPILVEGAYRRLTH